MNISTDKIINNLQFVPKINIKNTAALNVLEDQGFYCIDNLPLGLLAALIEQAQQQKHRRNL